MLEVNARLGPMASSLMQRKLNGGMIQTISLLSIVVFLQVHLHWQHLCKLQIPQFVKVSVKLFISTFHNCFLKVKAIRSRIQLDWPRVSSQKSLMKMVTQSTKLRQLWVDIQTRLAHPILGNVQLFKLKTLTVMMTTSKWRTVIRWMIQKYLRWEMKGNMSCTMTR